MQEFVLGFKSKGGTVPVGTILWFQANDSVWDATPDVDNATHWPTLRDLLQAVQKRSVDFNSYRTEYVLGRMQPRSSFELIGVISDDYDKREGFQPDGAVPYAIEQVVEETVRTTRWSKVSEVKG